MATKSICLEHVDSCFNHAMHHGTSGGGGFPLKRHPEAFSRMRRAFSVVAPPAWELDSELTPKAVVVFDS
jgi:hypothetical protein